jgi:hypothetical protein
MEREKEIAKLVNVLHRIARAAKYTMWSNAGPDAARFCVSQYNKVLRRLAELEPSAAQLFIPIAEDAVPEVTRMAAGELAAYFEEEPAGERSHHARARCGSRVWVGYAPVGGRCR